MIYTARVELASEGRTVILASVDDQNYFAINWEPRPEDEEDIRTLLTPKSETEAPYRGFTKPLLEEYNARFDSIS